MMVLKIDARKVFSHFWKTLIIAAWAAPTYIVDVSHLSKCNVKSINKVSMTYMEIVK